MQKGPQHCNVVSSGVSDVVVTDVVETVVSGNAWPSGVTDVVVSVNALPACTAAVDASSS